MTCGAVHFQEAGASASTYCFYDGNLFSWSGTTSVRYGTEVDGYEQQDRHFSILGVAERRRRSLARRQRIQIVLGGSRETCAALQ